MSRPHRRSIASNVLAPVPLSVQVLEPLNCRLPTVWGLSSVTVSAAVLDALNTAPAPTALGATPPAQLLDMLQLPLTVDAQTAMGAGATLIAPVV